MSNRLATEQVKRRDFLSLSGLWATAIAMIGAMIGALKLPMPRVTPEASSRFRIGNADEFGAGTERVIKDRNVLIRSTPEGVAAVSLVCTHLGCIVTRGEDEFHCPCHGSRFDDEGEVTGGPAPRGLRWLEVSSAADGSLVIDSKREVEANTYYLA